MLNKIGKLILILSLTVASAFTFTGCGTKSINLNDYLTYSISGYDGYGNAIVDFDLEGFTLEASSLYIGKKLNSMNDVYDLPEKKQTAVLQLNSDIYDMYYEDYIFDGSFDKYDHLSNGDIITYKWVGAMDPSLLSDLKEKYKLEIVCSDFLRKYPTFRKWSILILSKHLN